MRKEQWEKPELIVLMQNHPEETLVPQRCKHPGIAGPNDDGSGTPSCAESDTNCHDSSSKS